MKTATKFKKKHDAEIIKTSNLSLKIICRPPQSCETIPLRRERGGGSAAGNKRGDTPADSSMSCTIILEQLYLFMLGYMYNICLNSVSCDILKLVF